MQRRHFLRNSSAVLAGSLLSSSPPGLGRIRPVGLQLYTVRTEMERDYEGTLARVASIGYREVEFAGYFGRTPEQVRSVLRANRLTAPAVHYEYGDLGEGWQQKLDAAAAIGHAYIVQAWIPAELRRTLDDWRRVAEAYNRAASQARAAGLGFAYHNHSYGFDAVDGRIPYELLLESTDPALVKLEMDLYWITLAGQDPLAYFARWPGRIPLVHIKDRSRDGRMVDVGAGTIDWRRLLARRGQAGIRHFFVEHDEPADAFQSITNSYRYLSRLSV